jgi:toxin ParE1/3/4
MPRLRVSATARNDILGLLVWTGERFGDEARQRYQALIQAALADLAANPEHHGSILRPELGEAIRSYHLRHSRQRIPAGTGLVGRPRHWLLYRIGTTGTVDIGRVLHDAMDVERHLRLDLPEEP